MAVTTRGIQAVKDYYGLSSDSKPTTNTPTGSTFFETDTLRLYQYNGSSWFLKDWKSWNTSASLLADNQVKGSPGVLHTLTFSCNDAAPTAGSIIVYDSLTETGTQVFNHTFTTTPFVPFSVILDRYMSIGIFVGFTTTNDVNCVVSYI